MFQQANIKSPRKDGIEGNYESGTAYNQNYMSAAYGPKIRHMAAK
mgnify:CR=1 FL=1